MAGEVGIGVVGVAGAAGAMSFRSTATRPGKEPNPGMAGLRGYQASSTHMRTVPCSLEKECTAREPTGLQKGVVDVSASQGGEPAADAVDGEVLVEIGDDILKFSVLFGNPTPRKRHRTRSPLPNVTEPPVMENSTILLLHRPGKVRRPNVEEDPYSQTEMRITRCENELEHSNDEDGEDALPSHEPHAADSSVAAASSWPPPSSVVAPEVQNFKPDVPISAKAIATSAAAPDEATAVQCGSHTAAATFESARDEPRFQRVVQERWEENILWGDEEDDNAAAKKKEVTAAELDQRDGCTCTGTCCDERPRLFAGGYDATAEDYCTDDDARDAHPVVDDNFGRIVRARGEGHTAMGRTGSRVTAQSTGQQPLNWKLASVSYWLDEVASEAPAL